MDSSEKHREQPSLTQLQVSSYTSPGEWIISEKHEETLNTGSFHDGLQSGPEGLCRLFITASLLKFPSKATKGPPDFLHLIFGATNGSAFFARNYSKHDSEAQAATHTSNSCYFNLDSKQ